MSSPETFDLLVIGAGPGGYVAAVRAAELGMKTACVEKDSEPGGVCLRVGCIPSKALLESTEYLDFARNRFTEHGISAGNLSMDLVKLMERKNSIVSGLAGKCPQASRRKQGPLIHGTARLRAGNEVEVFRADGKAPVFRRGPSCLPPGANRCAPLSPLGRKVCDKLDRGPVAWLRARAAGDRRGGYIGLELGSVWVRLGSKVTVIEMLPAIAATLDASGQASRPAAAQAGLRYSAQDQGVHSETSEKEVTLTLEAAAGRSGPPSTRSWWRLAESPSPVAWASRTWSAARFQGLYRG